MKCPQAADTWSNNLYGMMSLALALASHETVMLYVLMSCIFFVTKFDAVHNEELVNSWLAVVCCREKACRRMVRTLEFGCGMKVCDLLGRFG